MMIVQAQQNTSTAAVEANSSSKQAKRGRKNS